MVIIPAPFRRITPQTYLFVLAVSVSLVFSQVIYPRIESSWNANIDPDGFGQLARNIYHGKGFVYDDGTTVAPALNHAPLYPYLIASLYVLVGRESFVVVQIAQAFCHGMLTIIVLLLARRMFDNRVALVAQFASAVYPMLIWYTSRIWVETIDTLAVCGLILLLTRFYENPTIGRSAFVGLALGIAVLTKGVVFPFLILIPIFLAVDKKWHHLKRTTAMFLCTFAVISPWTIRNYLVSGEIVPTHTSLGPNLMQGDAVARYWLQSPLAALELQRLGQRSIDSVLSGSGHTMTDAEGDRLLTATSLSWNRDHPLIAIKRICINGLTFWYLSESPAKSIFLGLLQLPLIISLIVATRLCWRRIPLVRPAVLFIAYYWIVHMLIIGWARYSLPIVPLCLLLMSYLIVNKWFRNPGEKVT